jgi:hypothetical protein
MEMIFSLYLSELIAVISISVLAIVTPGPDFVIVSKNSLYYFIFNIQLKKHLI